MQADWLNLYRSGSVLLSKVLNKFVLCVFSSVLQADRPAWSMKVYALSSCLVCTASRKLLLSQKSSQSPSADAFQLAAQGLHIWLNLGPGQLSLLLSLMPPILHLCRGNLQQPVKPTLSGDQLKEHNTEAVDIALLIDLERICILCKSTITTQ